MNYTEALIEKFKNIKINLVKHDDSLTGLPCYIECYVGTVKLKDRGSLVLDLGNYIYRELGLRYQNTPEFRGKGKATTLRWFMSWDDIAPILPNIKSAIDCTTPGIRLPLAFTSLIIQNSSSR